MNTKVFIGVAVFVIFILLIGNVTALLFLFDLSSKNKLLTEANQRLSERANKAETLLSESEKKVDSLNKENSHLSDKVDSLTTSYEQAQLDYEELYNFTYCGDDFLKLEMVYRSNTKASETLTQWVDEMWGDVLHSNWSDLWSADAPSLHVVETGYANNYFIVYFEVQDFFDTEDGVFMVSHQCWLDGGPK